MKVKEAMCNDVQLIGPDQTIRDAARRMVEIDAGALPVAENDRLVGMITDRDIAVRAVALGKSPDTKVRDIMSGEVLYCFDDEDLTHVSRNMSDMKVRRPRRLPRRPPWRRCGRLRTWSCTAGTWARSRSPHRTWPGERRPCRDTTARSGCRRPRSESPSDSSR